MFTALNSSPLILSPQPHTSHPVPQNYLFYRLIFSSHLLSQTFGSYHSDRCKFSINACQSAEQKRDFLLHLPSLEHSVLLFQSSLNSKWGDCCSDKQEGICITELAVSGSKEILYTFLISKGIALISFDDVSQLIF